MRYYITEEWDNGEDYEEHDGGLEVTAVHETAEQARRAALIIAASCPVYGAGGWHRVDVYSSDLGDEEFAEAFENGELGDGDVFHAEINGI